MTDLYDRYLEKIATDRTKATIQQVRALARDQSAVENQILSSLNDVTDIELRRLMEGAIARAKDEPVNWWDLLRSEQANRLILWRFVFEVRMLIGVMMAGAIGVFIGYLVWGRSPPTAPLPDSHLTGQSHGNIDPKNTR